MASRYAPEQLKSDMVQLNDRVAEVGAWLILIRDNLLEDAAKVAWNTWDAISNWSNFNRSTLEFTKEKLKNGNEMGFVQDIYDRCFPYAHLDPDPFRESADSFDAAISSMLDITSNPGNILTDIGNWYGDAAESFEVHLLNFGVAKSKQSEVVINLSNGCNSIYDLIENTQNSIQDLIKGGIEFAEERCVSLENDSSAKDTEEIKRLVFYISAGVSASAFTKVAKDVEEQLTGSSLLTFASLQFIASEKNINSGSDVNDIPDSIRASLNSIEESFQSGDEDIHNELEKVLSSWSLKELVFPAPAGLSNISSNDFRHESEL